MTRKRAKQEPPDNNVSAMVLRHHTLFTIAAWIVLGVAGTKGGYWLAKFVYINRAFGHAAWRAGLRIVDLKEGGHLSTSAGQDLTTAAYIGITATGIIIFFALFIGLYFVLPYMRMRLRGEKLSEQLELWFTD